MSTNSETTTEDDVDTVELRPREPVLVDPSGRRHRALRCVAVTVFVVFTGYLATLVAIMLG